MVNSRGIPGLIVVVVGAVFAGSGCTTQLQAKRISTADAVPVAGAPYYLPFTQFTIGITRRVTHCGSPGVDAEGQRLPETIDIKVIPTITRAEVPDPQRLYVIDFNALQGALKKTDTKVAYHPNGMLKSVNAAAEDRTGPVVIGVVTTAAKIAVSAATGGVFPATAAVVTTTTDQNRILCSKDVDDALATIKKVVPLIQPTAEALTRLAGEVASLTAQGQVLGGAWPDEGKKLWEKKLKDLSDTQAVLTRLQSDVGRALSTLSVTEKTPFVWPSHGEDRGPKKVPVVSLTDEQIKKWGDFGKDVKESIRTMDVTVSLTSTSPIARTKPCLAGAAQDKDDKECSRDDAKAGFKYRVSAAGSLVLCMQDFVESECPGNAGQTCKKTKFCPAAKVLAEVSGSISQLGPVFTLPLKSAVFTSNSVTAVFDEQGRPLELGVVSSAAAEEAATTAAGVTDAVLKARDAVVTTRLERLKEETEILKAEKELEAAKKALEAPTEQQTELVALQADTALLTARLANLEAEAALKKAQQLGGQ